jgi:cation:H+ antiporter
VPAWLLFACLAAMVTVAGARLARDGDAIAERTGLGATWVGAILVAAATSLPEIATDVSAVRQGNATLAIGDLFGSSMMNMAILAAADLVTRQTRLATEVAFTQPLLGALAVSLTSVAAIGVLAPGTFTILGIGWPPLLLGAGYVLGMRLLSSNRPRPARASPAQAGARRSMRRAVAGFSVSTVVILAAAPHLASSGAALAQQWGIATGFFGVAFLAAATSLPEAAVVFTAVRHGAHDLAVGNLLGSNCFNMLVLLILDVVDGSGALLNNVESGVVVSALVATLLMGQVLLDLLNRPERRVWYLEPGPALTLATYAAGLLITYHATK